MAVSPLLGGAELMESLKTREGREYLKVEILSNDDVGIRIRQEAGMARIAFQNLPADLQTKYHYDPSKAAAQKAQESKAQLEHETGQPSGPDASKETPPVPQKMDAVPATAVVETNPPVDESELQKLEAYIVRMKLSIESAEKEARNLRSQAMTVQTWRSSIKGYDAKGKAVTKSVEDKSGKAKRDKMNEQAETIDRQILQARALIGTAEAKYNRLTGIPNSPEPAEKSPGSFR